MVIAVLGRPEHVEAATGIRRVHVAGTHAWMPACVVHDDGRVEPLPFTWDRERLAATVLTAIGDAREVAVDGITPWWRDRLAVALVPFVPFSSTSTRFGDSERR